MTLDYSALRAAVASNNVGVRARTRLQPLGGPDDKVFPPTYEGGRYATETRRINGEACEAVVLDSVASQANRQELALLVEKNAGAPIPTVAVDFGETDVPDLDAVTALEASHRVFDAVFRDSLNGDTLFRLSPEGRAITEATPKSAAPLLAYSPTTLLFGGWDSTGPKGGLGAKYERAMTSEIVAIGIEAGAKTSSRIDVLGIEKSAGTVFVAADPDQTWEIDESLAATDKKGPVLMGKGSDLGRPSQVNHGNIVPSIKQLSGGVTADEIIATSVLSFVQLRRLRFPVGADGEVLEAEVRADAEAAARTALAALGLLALVAATEQGYDLRSRCVLVAETGLELELVGRTLDDTTSFTLTTDEARSLLEEAVKALEGTGLQWRGDDLVLTPTPKLVELILRSREVAATADPDEADD